MAPHRGRTQASPGRLAVAGGQVAIAAIRVVRSMDVYNPELVGLAASLPVPVTIQDCA